MLLILKVFYRSQASLEKSRFLQALETTFSLNMLHWIQSNQPTNQPSNPPTPDPEISKKQKDPHWLTWVILHGNNFQDFYGPVSTYMTSTPLENHSIISSQFLFLSVKPNC